MRKAVEEELDRVQRAHEAAQLELRNELLMQRADASAQLDELQRTLAERDALRLRGADLEREAAAAVCESPLGHC